MLKVFLVIVVVAGFSYVGFGISSYYKKRSTFFSSLSNLCEKIRADIDFSGKNLLVIFQEQNIDGSLGKVVENFIEYLKNKDVEFSSKQLFRGVWILKDEEKNAIFDFFTRLGRHDLQNEIKLIDDFKMLIEPLSKVAAEEKLKYGKMSVKVSFLLGLMVAILIV